MEAESHADVRNLALQLIGLLGAIDYFLVKKAQQNLPEIMQSDSTKEYHSFKEVQRIAKELNLR